jgi:hypothetical protein
MIRKSNIAEVTEVTETVDPAELVALGELSAEGFGWGSVHVRTPSDAIAELAHRLDGEVVLDDLGRRCVSREVARRLLTERAESEARQRAAAERQATEHAEQWRAQRRGGMPADQIPDGVLPAVAMLQAAKDAAPKRRTVLQEALDNEGSLTYHRIRDES